MKNRVLTALNWSRTPHQKWIFFLLGLVCLVGCERYQHENLKVGQPEMVAIDIKEKYVDTEMVMNRLAKRGIKVELDSLLLLADILESYDETSALVYAQEANRIAVEKGQDLSRGISLYYITMLKARQKIFGEGLEELIVDAKLAKKFFEKEKRVDWTINNNSLIGAFYYMKNERDSAKVYYQSAFDQLNNANLSDVALSNMKGEILYNFGTINQDTDTNKAGDYFKESLALYQSVGNKKGLNRLKIGIGYFYFYKLGLIVEADSVFQESLEYGLKNNDFKVIKTSYQGLAAIKLHQFNETSNKEFFRKGINYLRKQLDYQQNSIYYIYQYLGWGYHIRYDNLKDEEPISQKERILFLDSAIVNYKKAVFYAQKDGVIETMKSIGNNISELCEIREMESGMNCDTILGSSFQEFLNGNYVGIINSITDNLVVATQKNQEYEQKEQEIIHQQNVFKQRMIYSVGLAFSALFFLIVLQRVQQKRLLAKMEALRAQINPHFISNSLNAIESLVNLNQKEAASKYLVHFSRLARRILNNSREATVTLKDELETLEHFLALEQLRFRDKLHFDIEIQEGLNPKAIYVPAMIMQPFVENSIWHGIKPKTEAGLLKIIVEKDNKHLHCIIEDNGIGREKAKAIKENSVLKHKSQGMQISQERLDAIGKMKGAKITIIDLKDKQGNATGTRVVLRFPLKFKK